MQYRKRTRAMIMMALFVSTASIAKVTYEDALKDNAEAKAKHEAWFAEYSKPENNQPLGVGDSTVSSNEWRTIFSGSTTGSVNIPSDATEVYIVSTEGARMFPRNSSYVELGSVTKIAGTSGNKECAVATAKGTYSNGVLRGASVTRSGRCSSSSNHSSTVRATAVFEIKSVMVK